jgi:hypothetical protein
MDLISKGRSLARPFTRFSAAEIARVKSRMLDRRGTRAVVGTGVDIRKQQ